MGQVIRIVTVKQLEEAWEHYASKAREIVDDPKLLCDREFNQELAKRHERWRRLYLQTEHAG